MASIPLQLPARQGKSPVVFLTGVTGFLGGALLAHLLEGSFQGRAVCLARASDPASAEERVRRSLLRFLPVPARGLPDGVKVLCGDLLSDTGIIHRN